jgi:hypothetical protein
MVFKRFAAALRVPGPDVTLTLMPASLDLAAFDQMFRSSGGVLHRWTSPPRVIVQSRVLQFTNVSDVDYTALGTVMSDADATSILVDLTWTLPQLTGNTFSQLGDQQRETASEGDRVHVSSQTLDRNFDTSASPFKRSLRAHEFGHALGYNHVTGRASVMNSAATIEPNAFDRDGAKFAFLRPPLNHSPDVDPDPFTGNLRALTSQIYWAGDR